MFFLSSRFIGLGTFLAVAMMTASTGFAESPAEQAAPVAQITELELDGHTLVVADRLDANAAQSPGAEQVQVRAEVLDALHDRLKSAQAES